ncbi:uncharacterized protein C8Q71DRAFT_212885 [Rhodofomes roseus]|uniref:Uncharacterized protein n=1 Tax=Rhodofomes roseus TaxID=34475 RepID=A0ABQ8KU73_9APHY|nr:uncharacterized protein C8Q71DRAFT_212885 [Rhodofomes roseus]KAH9842628.1 hypothetical protein C8Q71DRAFT_212885 [Rhodofomes roseus]
MAANPDPTGPKPSASSSRSGGHSPSSPPSHAHTQRKPAASASILNAGMGASNGLKVLSSGWQVWGNNPSGVRNVSTSSSGSAHDPSTSQTDSYRSSLGDAWGSRSTSGTWDEVVENSQKEGTLTDYSAYYSGPSAPVDYQYSYDAYRPTSETLYAPSPALTAAPTAPNVYPGLTPQSLHPHAVPDIHNHQSGIFYDYAASPRPMGSQYYYPTQPMVYHAPPTHSPLLDKKRDIQVRYSLLLLRNSWSVLLTSPPNSTPHNSSLRMV